MENDGKHRKIKQFLEIWKNDYAFNTMVSAIFSFGVTILFALYSGFLGVHLASVWHGSICIFYLLLVAIRGIILLTEKKNITRSKQEKAHHRQKTYIISSVMLLLLNLALILPVSLMVTFEKPVNMGLTPAIVMAAYTTYKITMASVHIRKQKHSGYDNVLVSELRAINFIDALVSVLTLQNTLIMVKQAETNPDNMLLLSIVTGTAIYTVITLTSIYLLIKGLRQSQ